MLGCLVQSLSNDLVFKQLVQSLSNNCSDVLKTWFWGGGEVWRYWTSCRISKTFATKNFHEFRKIDNNFFAKFPCLRACANVNTQATPHFTWRYTLSRNFLSWSAAALRFEKRFWSRTFSVIQYIQCQCLWPSEEGSHNFWRDSYIVIEIQNYAWLTKKQKQMDDFKAKTQPIEIVKSNHQGGETTWRFCLKPIPFLVKHWSTWHGLWRQQSWRDQTWWSTV